jgi:predicted amidohydrolase YtcJ
MPSADLIFKNASVITMDPRRPAAGGVAVRDGKIMLTGDSEDLETVTGPGSRIIDCRGKTLIPGFIDAHCHVFSLLRKLLSVDLSPPGVKCIDDIKASIRKKAGSTPKGEWIAGTDYNDFYLAEKRHPTSREIDEAAPDHPVVLSHRSLHACVLNSRALALAGITRETEEPPGGHIDRDMETGEPNGLLIEMVGYIREKVMPPISGAALEDSIALANREYLSSGITSLQDATFVNDYPRWQKFKGFIDSDRLKSRLYVMSGVETAAGFREAGLAFGSGDEKLRRGGIKIVLSEMSGHLNPPREELNRQVLEAHRDGYQLAIHAVQPSTVEAAIAALENARRQMPRKNTRHRIEHCAECPPALLERLEKAGALVVTQPPFIYYSGERYLALVPPERQPWLYRFKSFLESGIVTAGSSDSPIAPVNPLAGIYAAVTRQAISGQSVRPEECISARQALEMYTVNAAYASFEEGIKGSLTPGKLADMALLSDDPLQVPAEKILDIRVEMTVIGGEIVREA